MSRSPVAVLDSISVQADESGDGTVLLWLWNDQNECDDSPVRYSPDEADELATAFRTATSEVLCEAGSQMPLREYVGAGVPVRILMVESGFTNGWWVRLHIRTLGQRGPELLHFSAEAANDVAQHLTEAADVAREHLA